MLLHKFKARVGRRVALTPDPREGNLPDGPNAWVKIGETNVQAGGGPRIAASSDEILEAVEKDGLIVWPIKIEDFPSAA